MGESIRAGVRWFTSKTFRSLIPYIAVVASFVGGWFLGVRTELAQLRTEQHAAFRAVNERLDTVDANVARLSSVDPEKPGKVIRLEKSEKYAYGQLVRTWAAAYGGEPEKLRKLKRGAATELAEAYQNRIDNGTPPSIAFEEVVRTVAVR
jgi:hypothetical protein